MDTVSLLEELAAALTLPEIRPDEVTAKMLADRCGINRSTARNRLEAKVRKGELTWRWVKCAQGAPEKAYRKPPNSG